VLFMYMHFRVKPVHPGTNTVHLQEQIGETGSFDNNFFCGFCVGGFWCNQLCDNPVEQIPAVPSPGLTLLNYGQPCMRLGQRCQYPPEREAPKPSQFAASEAASTQME